MAPTSLSDPQSLIRSARRSVALVTGLSAAVALHHGGMLDLGMNMDIHDAPTLVLCLGVSVAAGLVGWAAPPPGAGWELPIHHGGPSAGVRAVPVPSPARDGPSLLQVFLN